jgi:hypothetical protein
MIDLTINKTVAPPAKERRGKFKGENMKIAAAVFGVIIGLFALTWMAEGNDFFLYQYFAPKRANVERQVFENTQSFVQGKVEYLTRLRFQYSTAEGNQKAALKQLILDEASTVDNSKLPIELQGFIQQLKGSL